MGLCLAEIRAKQEELELPLRKFVEQITLVTFL